MAGPSSASNSPPSPTPPGRLGRWARGPGAVAVLRVDDQARDRSPVVCVKTGVRTDHATRATAPALARAETWELFLGSFLATVVAQLLRRPVTTVVLAVTPEAWRAWRVRLSVAIVISTLGLGLVMAGLVGGHPERIPAGVVLALFGAVGRARAWRNRWVGLRLVPDRGEVVVTRAHPQFDAEARRLYVAALRRR